MSKKKIPILFSALVAGALWAATGSAHAATYRWVGPSGGSWNSAANWFPFAVPGANDSAIIDADRIVSIPTSVTVANLTVGANTQIKTVGGIKVTGITNSLGLFTGTGTLEIPVGGSATYDITAANLLASVLGTNTPVVLSPINNKGSLIAKVAQGCRVDFASINNTGTTEVTSDGTVTFKDIANAQDMKISASGTLKLAKINNASGASLSLASTPAPGLVTSVTGLVGNTITTANNLAGNGTNDTLDPVVIHLDSLTNQANGTVKIFGSKTGRYFDGTSINNSGNLEINGAQTLLKGEVVNAAGAVLTVSSDARIFASDGTAPKLNNAGKILKPAGSDATLNVAWASSGDVVVENGTLHVAVPLSKGAKQTGGTTTLEGGVLSVEDPLGLLPLGTYELAGGTLDGIGTISGNVINSAGRVAPGHSPGTVVINGNYTQTSGGVLDMEVGGTQAGTGYDQLQVNGTAALDGTLNWVRWNSYVPQNGDVYTLLTFYSRTGKFAQFVDKAPVSGLELSPTLTPSTYEVNCYSATNSSAPTVSISSPTDGRAVTAITTATGTSAPAGSAAIKTVTCRLYRYANPVTGAAAGFWDGGTSWTTSATAANEEPVKGTTSWTFTLPTMVAGRYQLRATATDGAGNSASSSLVTFWVDPNAPTVLSVDTPANGASVSSLTQINGTSSDASDGSGVISVQCQLKRNSDSKYWTGSAWSATVTSLATNISGTKWTRNSGLPTGSNLQLGGYTVIAIATDRAGNTKTVNSTFTVTSSSSGS